MKKMINSLLVLMTAASLIGCGKKTSDSSEGTMTFTDFSAEQGSLQTTNREYDIQMQSAQFMDTDPNTERVRPRSNAPAPIRAESELSKKLIGLKIEFDSQYPQRKMITLKMIDRTLKFSFTTVSRQAENFEAVDNSGSFVIQGRCSGGLCESANLNLRARNSDANQDVEIRYSRTTEYLQTEDLNKFKVNSDSDALLREAIEYGFPVSRHSSRVDDFRDLEVLVIERPTFEDDAIAVSVELDAQGTRAQTKASPSPSTAPSPSKKPEQRTANPSSTPIKPITTTNVIERNRMSLTRNPFVAYNVEIPDQLFKRGTVLRQSSTRNVNPFFSIVPISQQHDLEPAYRIATIADAMVAQRVRIFENACNIFVRAAMALAGYLQGEWPKANHFENVFMSERDGLNSWDMFNLSNDTQAKITKNGQDLEQLLRELLVNHAVIFQVERRGPTGHVGIVTKENGKFYFYDAQWKDIRRGTVKKEVELKNLIRSYPGHIRIHAIPNLVRRNRVISV